MEAYTFSDAEMAKLKEVVAPAWDKFVTDMEEKGLPGKAIMKDFITKMRELGEDPPYDPSW